MIKKICAGILGLIFTLNVAAQSHSEETTAAYFEAIKSNPHQLEAFLKKMPKGGDLHNHHGGASLAENLIAYAKDDQLCVDQQTLSAYFNKNCAPHFLLNYESLHPNTYNTIINAWSMRDFHPGKESGHDHFFATFGKYLSITSHHSGEILSEIVERAGTQNELYIELMVTPDQNASGLLGNKLGWDANFEKMREKLLQNGLDNIVYHITQAITADEKMLNAKLHCQAKQAARGCDIKVRYLYQILREQPPENVFAQLLAGFELASTDKRVVGINMVQPEDGKLSMRDYDLHMKMVGFLHHKYPQVHISLHAGELIPGLVPNDGLRSHIRKAVEIAHAERIGHGVDITYEDNKDELLRKMAHKQIMVEINLVSNEAILNVTGKDHPLPLYMTFGVPVALSTDDEGVLRTNLTEQYVKAVQTYHFSYQTLKKLVRNSITYSFLPGKSLWVDDASQHVVPGCKKEVLGASSVSSSCQTFLDGSEKAQMQWKLEKRFNLFEN